MAKYYFRLALLILGIVAIFWVIGSLLPRSYSFQSEIEIASTPDVVFGEVNSLKKWQSWSRQWNPETIESLTIDYNGQDSGVGAAQTWEDIRGSGKLWITESEQNKKVAYDMEFGNFPRMKSQIEFFPAGSSDKPGTKVKWSSQGKLPSGPFYGFFGSFFSGQMQNEYDKSLEKLKQNIEAMKSRSTEDKADDSADSN